MELRTIPATEKMTPKNTAAKERDVHTFSLR